MSETTRAPWAKAPPPTEAVAAPQQSAPGAGAAVTRAPWANAGGAAAGAGGDMAGTRAPWAQGVAIGAGGLDKVDFDTVARQHPEYAASVAAVSAATAAAAAPVSSESAAAASSSSSSSSSAPLLYGPPCKLIKTPAYMSLWPNTCAYAELMAFVLLLNSRVRGVPCAPPGQPTRRYSVGPKVRLLVKWLEEARAAIAAIPPLQQSMRFGNKAFRVWHEQSTSAQHLAPMLAELLGPDLTAQGAAAELLPYVQDSFGSLQRIDYGTGHELNFVLFLCACTKLGVFKSEDMMALVLEVFRAYILLMQELQSVYWLEPAGSKGAWGLDDYQFLVFLWGSSQLQGSVIAPSDLLKDAVVQEGRDKYLFLLGLSFIHRMKSGPFWEHSAYLHQISQLPHWNKANDGLVRMWAAEVLGKFPIVQHVLFGRLLKFSKFDPAHERLGVQEAREEDEARERRKKQQQQLLQGGKSEVSAGEGEVAKPAVPLFEDAAAGEERGSGDGRKT